MKILGIKVDSKGSTSTVLVGREVAAMAAWFRNHRWFCCKRIPIVDRFQKFYATAGAAFLYGAGGWTFSHHVWERCSVIAGWWLRAMMHGNDARGKDRKAWGAPALSSMSLAGAALLFPPSVTVCSDPWLRDRPFSRPDAGCGRDRSE